ncbi:MAG TPA: SagB/ThcOx family dehydrogenase [Bacteroidales bacterium]|nr:SagB/ThcOx family dehydrogenase [Bacteroidales bacterium]
MKKLILLFVVTFAVNHVIGQELKDLILPAPNKDGGKPLMASLNERCSTREFDTKELSLQQISDLLWAANGVNRPEQKMRTAPTAMNDQEIEVYVALASGIYLYDAFSHTLKAIKQGDYRKDMGRQDFVASAPIVLVYVADFGKMPVVIDKKTKRFYSATDVGYVSQNVYLFAASENLATVVLGWISKDKIAKMLNLKRNQHVLLSQPVGMKKN